MKGNPIVYIILPIYNGETYFLEQLMSLYYQTYKNWYLIIVNDGSTDSSEDIAKKFVADYDLHDKVKIFKKRNGGLNSAIQRGLEEVKKICDINGDNNFIAYCDCDDIWTRNKLSVQVEYMVNHSKCGLLYSNLSIINEFGELTNKSFLCDNYYNNGDFLYVSTMGICCVTGTMMFRAKYIDNLLPMPTQEGMAQDTRTTLVLSLLKVEIHYLNKILFYYRKLSTGLQGTLESKPKLIQNQNRMNYFIALEDRYPNKDLSYLKQYNFDRFIKWYNKGYSLITIYLLMLFKYPKIFFLGLKTVFIKKSF